MRLIDNWCAALSSQVWYTCPSGAMPHCQNRKSNITDMRVIVQNTRKIARATKLEKMIFSDLYRFLFVL